MPSYAMDVLATSDLSLLILCRAGLNSAGAMTACSRAIKASSAEIFGTLCASFPYVAFGEDEDSMFPTALTPLRRCQQPAIPQIASTIRFGVIRGGLRVRSSLGGSAERDDWLSVRQIARTRGSTALEWCQLEMAVHSNCHRTPVPSVMTFTGCTSDNVHLRHFFEEMLSVQDAKQKSLPTTLHSRCAAALAVLNGELYACGGLTFDEGGSDATECFDPETETWHILPPPLPRVLCRVWEFGGVVASQLCFAASFREQIPLHLGSESRNITYASQFFGEPAWSSARSAGLCSMNSAERFDFRTGQWELIPSMLQARSFAAAAVVGGRLYVCGGQDEAWNVLDTVERFNPQTEQWEELPPLRAARCSASAGSLGGRPCVCAGLGAHGEPVRSVEVFIEESGKWEMLQEAGDYFRGQQCIGPVAVVW